MYDERLVAPMREELTKIGFTEMRTGTDVDEQLAGESTALIFVNSVCGCAAGGARPGLTLAMQTADKKPDKLTTVFAGQDSEATGKAREHFVGYAPSSPAIGLLKDGKLVFMMERHDIEGRMPMDIANKLLEAFNTHC